MNTIRAIETHYNGYRFRSRLEARWAVFFDALDLKWEYEPEGFVTSAGPYLPDFRVWTPQSRPMWYEVKPEHVKEDGKFKAFCGVSVAKTPDGTFRGCLLSGDPTEVIFEKHHSICPRCGAIDKTSFETEYVGDSERYLNCYPCDMETPCGGGHDSDIGVAGKEYYPHKGLIVFWNDFLVTVRRAADKARAARFEHGARG